MGLHLYERGDLSPLSTGGSLSGELIALFSALLWAVSSVLLTVGVRRVHVLPMNFVRCVVSTVFFWVLLPFYGGIQALQSIPVAQWIWMAVSVLTLLVIGDSLYFHSMDLAGVSWAMPVASTNPLWAVLGAALLLDEPLTVSLLAGALLVFAGVVLVSWEGPRSAPRVPTSPPSLLEEGVAGTNGRQMPSAKRLGLILAASVSLIWGLGQVSLKPATADVHSVVANSIRQPMGTLVLLGLALPRGRWRSLLQLDKRSWLMIIVASIVGTGMGTLFFVISIQIVGAGRAAILTSTSPLMAIPFSFLWLGERPTRWTLAGTLLTVVGIVLVA